MSTNKKGASECIKPIKSILKRRVHTLPTLFEVPFYPAESAITVLATKDSEQVSFILPTGRVVAVNSAAGSNPAKFATKGGGVVSVYSREFCVTLDLKTLETDTEWALYPLPEKMTTDQWGVTLPESFMKQHDIKQE
jgi:hypothetical protein